MSLITIKNLWKQYGDNVVLEKISLNIEEGEFCTLVGPSGCGKTTFLKMLLGQETPTRGTFLLDGEPFPQEPSLDRGIVFQRYSVFEHLSVLGNVMFAMELKESKFFGRLFGKKRKDAKETAMKMLEAVGLGEAAEKYPSELSGGMQQRRSIAQSLVNKPKSLLLDEPFGALDEITRDHLNEQLLRLWDRTQKTVIFVTHSIPESVFLSSKIVVMSPRPGKIIDIIDCNLQRDRTLDIRETPVFLEIAHRVSGGLRDGPSYDD